MSVDRISLGEAAGDCLKAIYKLQSTEGRVGTSALAAQLGVAEPTVTAMVKRLAKLGLLHHAPYRGVELTPSGQKVALEIIRHHRLLELYLVEALGLGWDRVHAEAERLEHLISDEVEDRMDAALGHPTTDPHGDPIPSKEGRLDEAGHGRLVDLQPGQEATVCRVPDGDPGLLQYLARLGLVPNARVLVVEKAPFGGPVTLEVADNHHAVGRELASAIQVCEPTARAESSKWEASTADPSGSEGTDDVDR